MNTENITALTAMLVRAGFGEQIGYQILARACFAPVGFELVERIGRNADMMTCVLRFERSGGAAEYRCSYYEVSLMRGVAVPDVLVGGVGLAELEEEMGAIDWRMREAGSDFVLGDFGSWERERRVADVVVKLNQLSATEEGKFYADILKLSYWVDAGLEELVGNLSALRAKYEISQKVYFIDGEAMSIDETYRFLLNRYVEKKMLAKRREGREGESGPPTSSKTRKRIEKKEKGKRGGSGHRLKAE